MITYPIAKSSIIKQESSGYLLENPKQFQIIFKTCLSLLYQQIYNCAIQSIKRNGNKCVFSQEDIARELGHKDSTNVNHAFRRFEELRMLMVINRGHGRACIYIFPLFFNDIKNQMLLAPILPCLSFQTPEDEACYLYNAGWITREDFNEKIKAYKHSSEDLSVFKKVVVKCTDLNISNKGESTREGALHSTPPIDLKPVNDKLKNVRSFYLTSCLRSSEMSKSFSADTIADMFEAVTGNQLDQSKAIEIATQWSSEEISDVFTKVNETLKQARSKGMPKNVDGGYLFAIHKRMVEQKSYNQTKIIENTAQDREDKSEQYQQFAANLCAPKLFENSKPVYSPHGTSVNTTRYAQQPQWKSEPLLADDAALDNALFKEIGYTKPQIVPYKFCQHGIKNYQPKPIADFCWTYEAFFYLELRKTPEGQRYEQEIMPFFRSHHIEKIIPFLENNPNYIPAHKRNEWMKKVLVAAAKLPAAMEVIRKEHDDVKARQKEINPKFADDKTLTLGKALSSVVDKLQKGMFTE
jgi:hypothetical protein